MISLIMSYPAYAQEVRLDLTSVITTILSPPHRTTEITAHADIEKERLRQQADVEKAKIAAEAARNIDRVSPILARWGVTRVACAPGAVFINGLNIDTVCINPINAIAAGYYNYSPERNLLVRLEVKNVPSPTRTSIPRQNIRANDLNDF
jgi:hypothetical protein